MIAKLQAYPSAAVVSGHGGWLQRSQALTVVLPGLKKIQDASLSKNEASCSLARADLRAAVLMHESKWLIQIDATKAALLSVLDKAKNASLLQLKMLSETVRCIQHSLFVALEALWSAKLCQLHVAAELLYLPFDGDELITSRLAHSHSMPCV